MENGLGGVRVEAERLVRSPLQKSKWWIILVKLGWWLERGRGMKS